MTWITTIPYEDAEVRLKTLYDRVKGANNRRFGKARHSKLVHWGPDDFKKIHVSVPRAQLAHPPTKLSDTNQRVDPIAISL